MHPQEKALFFNRRALIDAFIATLLERTALALHKVILSEFLFTLYQLARNQLALHTISGALWM